MANTQKLEDYRRALRGLARSEKAWNEVNAAACLGSYGGMEQARQMEPVIKAERSKVERMAKLLRFSPSRIKEERTRAGLKY